MSNAQLDPFAPPAANLDPRTATGEVPLASRGARLGAALLDFLVALPLVVISMVIIASGGGGMAALQTASAKTTLITFACGLPLNLFQWYLVTTTGQTIGKRWVKLRIVKKDGSKVDFVSGVVLRYWSILGVSLLFNLLNMPFIGGIFGFADALFIFREDRRTLHDLIAGTKVVAADRNV